MGKFDESNWYPPASVHNRSTRRGHYVNRNLQNAGHADKALKKRRAKKKAARKTKTRRR